MNTIKNLSRISDHLQPDNLHKLEQGANLHLRHSNIEFKILSADDHEIIIRTVQGKHMSKNYATADKLIRVTKDLFQQFFSGFDIKVQPIPFAGEIVDVVSPEWLQDKMLKKGIKITDIVTDTGIDRTNISAWVNDKRPMSQIVKAMFYFYFTR